MAGCEVLAAHGGTAGGGGLVVEVWGRGEWARGRQGHPWAHLLWAPSPSLWSGVRVCGGGTYRADACEIRRQQGLGPSRRGPRQFDLGLVPTERVEATLSPLTTVPGPSLEKAGASQLRACGVLPLEGGWAPETRGQAAGWLPTCPSLAATPACHGECGLGGKVMSRWGKPSPTPCREAGCPAEGALAPVIPPPSFCGN